MPLPRLNKGTLKLNLGRPCTQDCATKQGDFIRHLIYHTNLMAAYDEVQSDQNSALAVWGIQEHTISQTLIVDVGVQQLTPCMGLSTVGTYECCHVISQVKSFCCRLGCDAPFSPLAPT
jgi:hypothetical protein